jgi:hypothetical protein
MNRLDKKQIFIGTILGIILSILTLILLTRNIQPLSAQQTQPRFTLFKTAREGFKFMNMNDTRTYVGMQFRESVPYLATLNATSMLWITVNSSTPGAGFIVFTNKLNPNQQSWLAFTTSSLDFLMNTPSGITYAPIFAQTPTTNSPGNQVATKEYVLNVVGGVGGSDCPIFTRLNVQGVEKFVCLLGKIVEPIWNAYYGPITPVRYQWINEERTVVEVKNDPFFKDVLNKPIIGVRAWIDDKYDNTNGVCAILIPNKLAIVLTNAGDRYGATIFEPLDVKEFRDQYSVRDCGNWNHVAYGRFWTAFVTSGDRGGGAGAYRSEYETPEILFYKFGSKGKYVIQGETNNLYEGSCSWWPYLVQSAMSKGFDGDRFYLTENDKIIFDFTAVRRKSNIQFQCAIKFYYIP